MEDGEGGSSERETIMEEKRSGKMCNRHRRRFPSIQKGKKAATTARRRKEVESLKEGFKVKQGKMIN